MMNKSNHVSCLTRVRLFLRLLMTSLTVTVSLSPILYAQITADHPSLPPHAPDGCTSLYLVMVVALAVWIVISLYLIWIDRKITRLEKELQQGK